MDHEVGHLVGDCARDELRIDASAEPYTSSRRPKFSAFSYKHILFFYQLVHYHYYSNVAGFVMIGVRLLDRIRAIMRIIEHCGGGNFKERTAIGRDQRPLLSILNRKL